MRVLQQQQQQQQQGLGKQASTSTHTHLTGGAHFILDATYGFVTPYPARQSKDAEWYCPAFLTTCILIGWRVSFRSVRGRERDRWRS